MTVVFFGIYRIGVEALANLLACGIDVACVVTKPGTRDDRQPVADFARDRQLPLLEPTSVGTREFLEQVRLISPDLIVVAGFHRIFPQALLDIPRLGVINLHLSLLPKGRGPCPWKWAIAAGESVAGATVHRMVAEADVGDLIAQKSLLIDDSDTGETLFQRLSILGGPMIADATEAVLAGKAVLVPQDHSQATHQCAPSDEDTRICWTHSATRIRNQIRGFLRPCAWTTYAGEAVILRHATLLAGKNEGDPGEIIEVRRESLLVNTGDGVLEIRDILTKYGHDGVSMARLGSGEKFN